MKIRVADYVAEFIYNKGVKHVFTISGGGSMYLDDAVAAHKKLKYICNHHEQASVFAAESYSRVTQNYGVALVTSGPGATNTITGVFEAWTDSTPCMIISGQSKVKETIDYAKLPNLRQFGVFEVNIVPIVKTITKYAIMITDAKDIRYHLEKAYFLSTTGRPGPVWIDIPLDIQGAMIETSALKGFTPTKQDLPPKLTKQSINKCIAMLQNSKKPVIIAGNGIRLAKATKEFIQLAKTLQIPIVTTIMGTDLIAEDSPYYVGRVGIRGQRSGNLTVQHADVILSIGSRLSVPIIGYEYEKFAPQAKKIVVDIDPVEHQKPTLKLDLVITADAKKFMATLLKKNLSLNIKKDWLKKSKELKEKYPVALPEYFEPDKKVNIYGFVDKLSDQLDNKDIINCDAGSAFYIFRQAIKIKQGQRVLIAGGTGAMGFNLPSAIGASVATNGNRVISITGDGSFQTNIHELQTIKFNKLPVKVFIFNNNGYLSIKNTQNNYFQKRYMGVDEHSGVSLPDVAKIAKAYGITYLKINSNKELTKKIRQALETNGPVLCEVMCVLEQKIMPSVSTKKLPDGKLISTSIDDMAPFLSEEEMEKIRRDLE